MWLDTRGAILQVAAEAEFRAREGELPPGNLARMDELDFQALGPRAEFRLAQYRAEKNVDLLGMEDVHDAEERADLDLGQGLLPRLPRGALLQGLTVLEEARRDRPIAAPRLDCASAEENATLVLGYAADHQARILIVNDPARIADMPGQVIARWHAKLEPGPALGAEIHGMP